MSEKPETRFIARLKKRLPPEIFVEKTHNPYRRGIPDLYIEGSKDCLWVECKYLPKAQQKFTPALTPLQINWLKRAHENNRRVAVLVGSPAGAIWLPDDTGLSGKQLTGAWLPLEQIATWIRFAVTDHP